MHDLAADQPGRVQSLAAVWEARDREYQKQGATGAPLPKTKVAKAARAPASRAEPAGPSALRGPKPEHRARARAAEWAPGAGPPRRRQIGKSKESECE